MSGISLTSPADRATEARPRPAHAVRRFELQVADGETYAATSDRCTIGSDPRCQLVVADRAVSRFHCELTIDERGARLRDLDSRNGTFIDGIEVRDAYLRNQATIEIGTSRLVFRYVTGELNLPISAHTSFGSLVGASLSMRTMFAQLERAAATSATVLLEGETGTGKEEAAESLHRNGSRREGPFVVVDCGAIPPTLLESTLFGHERGAYTGAVEHRDGAFVEADGGTIFLDEIGELSLDLQPTLLRVLERRTVCRVGGSRHEPIDVRIIAATNRDLRTQVNAGRFRSDLYYRLAVVRIRTPPLRERPEDLPLLMEKILDRLAAPDALRARLLEADALAAMATATWPGNVRELRNYLERSMVYDQPPPIAEMEHEPASAIDPRLSYEEARRHALAEFQRQYTAALVRAHGGNVTQAARAAGIDRVYLHRLIRRTTMR